jgi:hypothetical protein
VASIVTDLRALNLNDGCSHITEQHCGVWASQNPREIGNDNSV